MHCVLLLLVISVPLLADAPTTPEGQLIAKAIAASGWGKHAGHMTWNDKGKFIVGGNSMEYTGDFHISYPDKYRFTIRSKALGVDESFTVVIHGDKAWQSMGKTTQEIKGDKLDYVQNELYLMNAVSLQPLLDSKQGFTLKLFDGGKLGDRPCTGLQIDKAGKPTIKFWFDLQTHLLAKAEYKVKNEFEGWKEATDEVFYNDWAGDEIKAFRKFSIRRNGQPMLESECSDFKFPERVDPKLYEKP